MDWSNERYVCLYTRDTPEWAALEWQARALFYELMRKVDRAGVLPLGKSGLRGLAGIVRMPLPVVEAALPLLLDDGCVVQRDTTLVLPNFMPANEASRSDKQRQRDSREARRAKAMAGVTERDSTSQDVTDCHARSHAVTAGHSRSHAVTSSHTPSLLPDPIRSEPTPTRASGALTREVVSGSNQPRAEANGTDAARSAQGAPKNGFGVEGATSVTTEGQTGQQEASAADLTNEQKRTLSYMKYAASYSAGVSAETGGAHAVTEPHELTKFGAITQSHAVASGKALRGEALDAWLRDRGAAYVRSTRHAAQYQRGYAPSKFLEWLSAGQPPPPNGNAVNPNGRPKVQGRTYNRL